MNKVHFKACLLLVFALQLMVAPVPAQTGDAPLEDLSVWQLCEMRGTPDAVSELRRRDLFSGRELRAIKKQKVHTGIRLEALICALGLPDAYSQSSLPSSGIEPQVLQFSRQDDADLIVFVHRDEEEWVVWRPPPARPMSVVQPSFPYPPVTSRTYFPDVTSRSPEQAALDLYTPEWDLLP